MSIASKKLTLTLNKEVLRNLSDNELEQVAGGASTQSCVSGVTVCKPPKFGDSRQTPSNFCTSYPK